MSARSCVMAVYSLCGFILICAPVQAMSLADMHGLPAAGLLDLRVDALLQQCGLPSAIADSAATDQPRQTLHWQNATMTLSAQPWEVRYARQPQSSPDKNDWHNSGSAGEVCLAGLANLSLMARGEVGHLTVRKRADNNGYLTTYTVPKNLYAAHQVTGYRAVWNRDRTLASLHTAYGTPDEVLPQADGSVIHRYWVVKQENRMPVSVHAVDFVMAQGGQDCREFSVYSRGSDFVQEKFDRLLREWEKIYVLD